VKVQQGKEGRKSKSDVLCLSPRRAHYSNMLQAFSHMKNKKKGERRQDRKSRYKNDGYKNKKKAKVMYVMWSSRSYDNNIDDSDAESGYEKDLNLALMTQVEEGPSTINIDGIIVSNNISDYKIIELLRNIAMSKTKKLESQQKTSLSASPLGENKIFLNIIYD
jgi:hypothetical protein